MIKPQKKPAVTQTIRSNKYLKLLGNLIIFPLVFSTFISCGSDNQFTKQILASPFVTKVFSSLTKTISINVPDTSYVDWIGLEQGIGVKFFKIVEVKIGDAVPTDAKGSPTLLLFDGDVAAIAPAETHTITMKIKYNPLEGITKDEKGIFVPHRSALLIVADDGGKKGTISITLEGYTDGVCTDCFEAITGSTEYTMDDTDGDGNPDFQFYLCDPEVIPANLQAKGPLGDSSDGITPSTPYNVSTINLTPKATKQDNPHITIYTGTDKSKVIIDSGVFDNEPSIPTFTMEVPGGKPIPEVDVNMAKGKQAICPVDGDGIVTCSDETESGILLSIIDGLVPVAPLTLTNGTIKVGNKQCPNFGTWTGSGTLSDDSMTIIGVSEVLDTDNETVSVTGITGALVVAVMNLKKVVK